MKSLLLMTLLQTVTGLLPAAEPRGVTREAGVIYGEKAGTKLTLDVFRPAQDANGAASSSS